MARLEQIIQRFTREGQNLVEGFVLGGDVREKRRGGKINARARAPI
jgi:hypothetical protein